MRLTILGNGGGISDGLPYNAFLVDDRLLAETPPDIMSSLFRERIKLGSIRNIFISHFHADHCFGFPFFALRLFYDGTDDVMTTFGPGGLKARMLELCTLAFGPGHPLREWLGGAMRFIETGPDSELDLGDGLSIRTIPMAHPVETLGFTLKRFQTPLFTYMPDTLWSEDLLPHIQDGGKAVLIDLNGEPGEAHKVHLSEADLAEKALPRCGDDVVFYGTHLKQNKKTGPGRIRYVRPGDRIEITD
ncbi:MAG TPA: MBL fold metallo-hydrolase [Spirochaetota bacterium]|nr:MBL fold metallo-hydrolase [Spirochaetota bacterium]